MPERPTTPGGVPSKAEIKRFVAESTGPVGRREIARAFKVKGADRTELRRLLKELADEGVIGRGQRKRYGKPDLLPAVAVVEVSSVDTDGQLYGRPVSWREAEPPPHIVFAYESRPGPAPGIGDRFLVNLERHGEGYQARTIRRLQAAPEHVVGVYTEVGGQGRVLPTDKRQRYEFVVPRDADGGAKPGELVEVELLPGRRLGLREVKVLSRLGEAGDPRSASLIAIHTHDIPDRFPEAALEQARAAKPVVLGDRTDLRHLPLVTMDGADARDFDDAICALPDEDPKNPGGWHIVVAIADVAHYVKTDSALDRSARERGNSVYFPDRVVPMLPHELSSDLCSLRPDEDRAVLAVEITITRSGRKLKHHFTRGLMRSSARLIYEQAQDAFDGVPSLVPESVVEASVKPVYAAWAALMRERAERQPLDLDLPELAVELDDDGKVTAVHPRARLDSHRVVEEFMILANVCAAETLEARRMACMYRIHGEPDREKLLGLREFLRSVGLNLTLGEVIRPMLFNRALEKAKETVHYEAVSQAVLRSQAQACYSPENIGHFGLALLKYAHFTSPIRRYSDLLVHRGLIRALGFGGDGLTDHEIEHFEATAEHISRTERRAMAAERDANDRYLAAYLKDHAGAEFPGRISGVTRAGLFVRLQETGADGLVPISSLGDEYFRFEESKMALIGERTRRVLRLGDLVTIRLSEVNELTGGMIFQLLESGGQAIAGRPKGDGKPPAGRGKGKSRGKEARGGKRR